MTTKKYIIKEQYKKYMTNKGLRVFNVHGRKHHEMYSLIVLACNKLNPEHPEKAYKLLLQNFRTLATCETSRFKKIDNIHAVPVVVQEDREKTTGGFHQSDCDSRGNNES